MPRWTRWAMRRAAEKTSQNAILRFLEAVLVSSSLGSCLGAVALVGAVVLSGSAWDEAVATLVGLEAGVRFVVAERLREPRRPGGAYLLSSVLEYAWGVSGAATK